MKNNLPLNGSDQLMRAFDFELRRNGFVGNQCQIILELAEKISPEILQKRISTQQNEFPILNARLGKIFKPKWKIPARATKQISIRVHSIQNANRSADSLPANLESTRFCEKLFNEPLQVSRGELLRFDLIDRGAQMNLIFTWAHTLMDSTSAEHFLAAVSDEKIVLPKSNPQPPGAPKKWPARLDLMKKSVAQLDKFCENQPRALKTRFPNAPRELNFHVEKFSADETKKIRANASALCGILGDAQFHAAVCALELHRLHQKIGAETQSYILPMPVGLRPKGKIEPLFSNQVDMLMLQFVPRDLDAMEKTVATLKTQTAQAVRENSIGYGRKLSEQFSFLPLPIFMAVLKHGLKGEICSLFFGDIAAVNPRLENFLGARVENFIHVAAVTPSPGLGVIFYYFRGELRMTIVHAKTVLSENEVAEFSNNLRARLLNP